MLESYYSDINDLTYLEVPQEEYLRLGSAWRLAAAALRWPTKTNVLRALACPVVKLIPSVRMLIVVVAEKQEHVIPHKTERWG